MLAELDLLLAVAALMLVMPTQLYQILTTGGLSSTELAVSAHNLKISSGEQRLAYQLSNINGVFPDMASLINESGYVVLPYNSVLNRTQIANARLVTIDGNLRYVGVTR